MLIKTLTLHSLTSISWASQVQWRCTRSFLRTQRHVSSPAMITQQVANHSTKGDRLPIKQAKPQPIQVPAQITPNLEFKTDCKPPIDILGRCFADVRVNYKVV